MSFILGCYGVGDGQTARAQLARHLNVNNDSSTQLIHQFGKADQATFSLIARRGAHTHVSQPGGVNRFALSVSGLPHYDDVWIETSDAGLKLGRDAFGRATLFYAAHDGVVWFATRLSLLLPLLPAREISLAGLYGYLSFSWTPAPLTAVAGVSAVPAGCEVVWRAGSCETRRTQSWLTAREPLCDEAAAVEQLRALLEQSGGAQCADVRAEPVGVFLSGGLDSSITAALLVRAGVRVRAYTLDFGDYGMSEAPYAESVARHLQIPLVKVDATPRRIRQALPATARALDQPYGDGVTVPLYLLNQAAANDVGCVFNGEGGDQLFAGWTNKPLIAAGVYKEVVGQDGILSHSGGDKIPSCPTDTFTTAYLRTFHRLHGYEAAVFQPALRERLQAFSVTDWLADALAAAPGSSLLARLRRANLMLKGAQNIQPRATNLALAHGLKLRTPFCSPALAAWTFGVSDELFLRGACEKYLLKRAVEPWLPADVVWREKRGMGAPLTAWCLGPLWRELGRWLDPASLKNGGVFQADLALRVATGALSGQLQGRRIGEILWLLLLWQVWRHECFSDEAAPTRPAAYNPFWLPARWWQFKQRLANG